MDDIRAAFARDHERLGLLLEAALGRIAAGDAAGCAAALTTFDRHLRTHIRIEEEVVFAAIERLPDEPVAQMSLASLRREHEVFRVFLGAIEQSLGRGQLQGIAYDLRELAAAFRLHHGREEQVIYPLLENTLHAATIVDMAAMLGED